MTCSKKVVFNTSIVICVIASCLYF